jgi:hypothetical protein
VVPPIGALAERVQGSRAGVVLTDVEWRDESRMLDRLVAVLDVSKRDVLAAMAAHARAIPHATIERMRRSTFALYDSALEAAVDSSGEFKVFEPGRVRAALRYAAWHPPSPARKANPRPGWIGRIAHAALERRNTRAGRMLARCTPATVRAALRSRLKP